MRWRTKPCSRRDPGGDRHDEAHGFIRKIALRVLRARRAHEKVGRERRRGGEGNQVTTGEHGSTRSLDILHSISRSGPDSTKGRACRLSPTEYSNRSAAPLTRSVNGAELDRPLRATRLLVDERRTRRADHLILRPGAARATDGADDLAVLDQRDASPRRDDVIEAQDVFEIELLHHVLEHLGRTAELDRGARLVL